MSADPRGPGSHGRTSGPEHDDRIHRATGHTSTTNLGAGSANPATAVSAKPGGAAKRVHPEVTALHEFVTNFQKRFTQARCNVSAWSLACKGFLAIFPAAIALLGLIHLLDLSSASVHRLNASIDKVLPPGASGVVSQAVDSASHQSAGESIAVLIGGLLVAVWSVAGGISLLQIALDIVYAVPHDRRFVARHLRSLPLMLATLTLGVIASALSVFGASVGHAIESNVPLSGTVFTIIWTVGRWVVTLTTITLLFQIFYSYGPNRKAPGWKWTSLGSAIGALIFVLASLGFSFYVKNFGSYEKTYGALAGVVILIIWLYLASLAVLVGAEVNAQLDASASAP